MEHAAKQSSRGNAPIQRRRKIRETLPVVHGNGTASHLACDHQEIPLDSPEYKRSTQSLAQIISSSNTHTQMAYQDKQPQKLTHIETPVLTCGPRHCSKTSLAAKPSLRGRPPAQARFSSGPPPLEARWCQVSIPLQSSRFLPCQAEAFFFHTDIHEAHDNTFRQRDMGLGIGK